jgi:hypothetical protein
VQLENFIDHRREATHRAPPLCPSYSTTGSS